MERVRRARVDVQSYREAAASDPEMTRRALVLGAVEAGYETLATITPFLAGGGVVAGVEPKMRKVKSVRTAQLAPGATLATSAGQTTLENCADASRHTSWLSQPNRVMGKRMRFVLENALMFDLHQSQMPRITCRDSNRIRSELTGTSSPELR